MTLPFVELLQADANTLLRNPALYVTNNNLGYILAVSIVVFAENAVADIALVTPAAGFSLVLFMHAEAAFVSASTGNGCAITGMVWVPHAALSSGGPVVWGRAGDASV